MVYVVPVVVEPLGGGDPYKAAAKLELDCGGGPYCVTQLYGTAPVNPDGCCHTGDCDHSECSSEEPRLQRKGTKGAKKFCISAFFTQRFSDHCEWASEYIKLKKGWVQ